MKNTLTVIPRPLLDPKGPVTLADLLEEYQRLGFVGAKPRTVELNRVAIDHFERWVGVRRDFWLPGHKVNPAVLNEYSQHASEKWGQRYTRRRLICIKRLLRWAKRRGFVEGEPWNDVIAPANLPPVERPLFTEEEYIRLRDLAATSGSYLHFSIVLAWASGWSISDCTMVRWSDVNMPEMEIVIHRMKTDVKSTCYIEAGSDLYRMLLERSRLPKDPSWPNNAAIGLFYVDKVAALATMNGDRVRFELRKLFDKCGFPKGKTFHSFRTTMASRCNNGGVSPILACRMLGHKDINTFAGYCADNPQVARDQLLAAKVLERARESEAKEKAAAWERVKNGGQQNGQPK